ncbi:MAG: FtsQ-type POTRA domain-containing protein [Patescibacteria group bacterium]
MIKKKDVLHSPRLLKLKKRRQRVIFIKIFLFLCAFVFILGGAIYVSRISSLNIKTVTITGNKFIETEAIKTAVEKKLAEKYLWFFPKTNIFIYPTKAIKEELRNELKRLKDIDLSLSYGNILDITVSERTASYVWCGDMPPAPDSLEQAKCNFLDNSGFMFDEAPYFSGEVYFKFYGTDLSGVDFNKLISFKKTLEVAGARPAALFIGENGNIKMFLSPENSLSIEPEIIFKADADFENVAENLQVALSTEPLKSNFKNKYSSLEYIDLRFGNKVYFKFR